MPVVGQQYVQFIVRLCKERDGISGSIVGARAKSVTTHVLYVLSTETQGMSDLETALTIDGAVVKTTADDVLDGSDASDASDSSSSD
jgi:hypothetical protein